MRWGSKKQQPGSGTPQSAPEPRGADTPGRKSNGKRSKAFSFSFSPLSWLAKLAPKPKDGTKQAPASAHEDGRGADAAPAFPSCVPERTSPAKVAIASVGRKGSPRRSPAKFVARRLSVGNDNADAVAARGRHRSPAKAAEEELIPRRLSVGIDNADAVAARRRCTLQRHHSIGGDRDIKAPLDHHIPFSLAASPALPSQPPPPQPAPSDTDAGSARPRHRRRGHRHRRSLSGGRRSSFSGRMTLRVKVRSSRRAGAGAELESLAVVRRTRDPQRAFRESMSEMIATSGGRPDELERLLACYLALNADEHHGCIVKVFRQVWFDHVNGRPAAAEPAGTSLRPTRAGADVN